MKKVVGYVLAVVGLVVMVIGFGIVPVEIGFLEGVAGNYVSGAGIVLVIIGAVIAAKGSGGSGRARHASEEVPIYEGTGKKRKIVGYRKD